MNVLPADRESIREAARIIRSGGLVAFPTETVYGLGANALDPIAVTRIFEAKDRPFFDPLIVHIADSVSAETLAVRITPPARALMDKFWPGPLTLVLPRSGLVPDIVTAGLPTVALRMPAHPVALELIREAGTPVAAPSANPFGYLSPTRAEHVREQLGARVEMILDGGPCLVGVESTIIKIEDEACRLLRPGGLPLEEIEKIVGRVDRESGARDVPEAPGQLPSHYAPRTPVRIIGESKGWNPGPAGRNAGLLAFRGPVDDAPVKAAEVLSPSGDLHEAAANLFSCLHRMDRMGLDMIYAEAVPETGLGRAIMDRLRRAEQGMP